MSNKKFFQSVLLGALTTVSLASFFHDKAQAITVDQNYQGKVCIYVPKAWVMQQGNARLEVYWVPYTMTTYVDARQFPQGMGWNAGGGSEAGVSVNGGIVSGSVNNNLNGGVSGTTTTNPNFGLELNAYGNNVTNIDTNFPVVGFEQQRCFSDYNIPVY